MNQKYKSVTTNDDPYISTASLIGYNLCLFYFQHLILDLKCRSEISAFALPFTTNSRLKNLVSRIMECKVPPELAIELKNLAPVFDPLHSSLEYIPSFACFSTEHDFGQSIPAYLCFMIHNILADVTAFTTPADLMNEIYTTDLLNYHGTARTVSNLFGGPYIDGTQQRTTKTGCVKASKGPYFPPLVYVSKSFQPLSSTLLQLQTSQSVNKLTPMFT